MPFSLRLDPETAARLRRAARARGWAQATVVREALEVYVAGQPAVTRPGLLDRVEPFIGAVDSRGAALSTDTHATFRAIVERKHAERRGPRRRRAR